MKRASEGAMHPWYSSLQKVLVHFIAFSPSFEKNTVERVSELVVGVCIQVCRLFLEVEPMIF